MLLWRSVQTVRRVEESTYTGNAEPKFKMNQYVRVYCGTKQDHCFRIADIRYNHDIRQFEYLYGGAFGCWQSQDSLVEGDSRKGWHYDSQGYCDNPGRGY